MNKKNILKTIGYIILLLPFFEIPYFKEMYPISEKVYQLLFILSSFVTLILVISKKKYSKIINYIVLFLIILLGSTIYNSGSIMYCVNYILNIIVLCFLTDFGVNNNTKPFLNGLEILLEILIIVNLFTIIAFPNGMYVNNNGFYQNWLLGYKNSHILYIFPALLISFINSYKSKSKFEMKNYILLIISFISTILVNNSTGITGLAIIAGYLIFRKKILSSNIFNIYNYIIINIVLFFSIVVFKVQNIFSFIIVDILHRDITFTDRIYVWEKAITTISEKKIFGWGNISFIYTNNVHSTHNIILGVLFNAGVVGLISFILMLYKGFKKLWTYRNCEIVKFVSIFFFAYLLMMLTETYNYKYFLYLLIIPYSIKVFIKEKVEEN